MPERTVQPIEPRIPRWGVYVAESHHAPGFEMKEGRFPFHIVAYILHGRGLWTSGKRSERCRAGDIVTVPIGQSHRFADEPGQAMSLYALFADASVGPLRHCGPLPANTLIARRVRDTMRMLLFEQTQERPAHACMMAGLTMQLLAVIERAAITTNPTARDRVADYAKQMEQTFFEPADIDTVAAQLNLSRRRFTQLFKEVTGETWLARLHRIRMGHARKLLRETDRTVISIAFECGYEDLSSFYRIFQRAEKTSPHRWRSALRPSASA